MCTYRYGGKKGHQNINDDYLRGGIVGDLLFSIYIFSVFEMLYNECVLFLESVENEAIFMGGG